MSHSSYQAYTSKTHSCHLVLKVYIHLYCSQYYCSTEDFTFYCFNTSALPSPLCPFVPPSAFLSLSPLLSMCSPCRSWTMAVCVAGTRMMLPSSLPHTRRPWEGMYTLAVTWANKRMHVSYESEQPYCDHRYWLVTFSLAVLRCQMGTLKWDLVGFMFWCTEEF